MAKRKSDKTTKSDNLTSFKETSTGEAITTNQGLRLVDDQNSLKAGPRGPSLLEDFHLREKITHFDHERIPERVVHARGAAAHGVFELYKPQSAYTKAKFLNDTALKTPVFVRFSTVAGSRGSADLARDVRGFAVKFYTQEGIFDLVGNNIPVFFIQDALKFPDLIHAVKPEPHNEIPQAASAHDTFWDFISLSTEATHMIMWAMSDRAIPRSFRMMEGFGVHTFRLINEKGRSFFVKFHWKPTLPMASVVWDEAQQISGKDPDFHRRDLWEAIETGNFPEWELGFQIVPEEDEHKFDFDLLDATKLIPEELVPVQKVGKMTLNRNPDNYFAETEQVAFHPGHLVPGIDFSNDPLLQGRLFSYTDTQLTRLGSPNFHEIPINRTLAPMHNNQRDGHMRQAINVGEVSYSPNTIGGGCPFQAGQDIGGFASFAEKINAVKIRDRSEKFFDHFSQATLFYNSQTPVEQWHMVKALRFELGKVSRQPIQERMLFVLNQVDTGLAQHVAEGLGLKVPAKIEGPLNQLMPADVDPKRYQPRPNKKPAGSSDTLSILKMFKSGIQTRKVAILATDGAKDEDITQVMKALTVGGARGMIVATHGGKITTEKGHTLKVDFALLTVSSVLFDAVYVAGGSKSVAALAVESEAHQFVQQAYKHCKAVALSGEASLFLADCDLTKNKTAPEQTSSLIVEEGVINGGHASSESVATAFVKAMSQHRAWSREAKPPIKA